VPTADNSTSTSSTTGECARASIRRSVGTEARIHEYATLGQRRSGTATAHYDLSTSFHDPAAEIRHDSYYDIATGGDPISASVPARPCGIHNAHEPSSWTSGKLSRHSA
jgi:hypothetical protein